MRYFIFFLFESKFLDAEQRTPLDWTLFFSCYIMLTKNIFSHSKLLEIMSHAMHICNN